MNNYDIVFEKLAEATVDEELVETLVKREASVQELDEIEELRRFSAELQPFDATVALRLADEGRRRQDAEEATLGLKVVAHILTAMVVAQREPGRRAVGHAPAMIPNALPHRFQRLEARAVFRGVQPHTFGGAMIDRHEDRDLAVGQGRSPRHVVSPDVCKT